MGVRVAERSRSHGSTLTTKIMARISKKRKDALAKFDSEKSYSLEAAAAILKEISYTKFDASVDIDVRLGVDPRKADQMVRGVVALPHGTGKSVRVLVLCTPDKVEEAKAAGADHVGLDDYIQKIEKEGWTDIDVIITMPTVMAKLGLMPNPKSGTVTLEVGKAVQEVKAGKIDFKVDKTGIIHAGIGKVSFDAAKIAENANEIIQTLVKLKPSSAKGTYVKGITLSSTMSPGIQIDKSTIIGL
jgi:large subunit ribosomal protein L1